MAVNDAVWFNSVWLNQSVKLELIPELSIKSIPFCLTLLNLICKDSAPPLRLVGNLFLWSGFSSPSFHFAREILHGVLSWHVISALSVMPCPANLSTSLWQKTREQEEEENLVISLESASPLLSVAIGISLSIPSCTSSFSPLAVSCSPWKRLCLICYWTVCFLLVGHVWYVTLGTRMIISWAQQNSVISSPPPSVHQYVLFLYILMWGFLRIAILRPEDNLLLWLLSINNNRLIPRPVQKRSTSFMRK